VAATVQALIGVYLQRHEVVESPLTVDAKETAEASPEAGQRPDASAPAGEAGAEGGDGGG
jgi:hypothetical protein